MDVVRRVLDREYPDRSVASVSQPARGNSKRTGVVTFADGEAVVVQVGESPDAVATEAALARQVAERTPVPVPTILATGRLDGLGYAVVERAPGTDLHESFTTLAPAARERLSSTFGRALAHLHEAFSFDAYGPLTVDPPADGSGVDAPDTPAGAAGEVARSSLRATGSTDWPGWFREYAYAGLDRLPGAFDDLRAPIREGFEAPRLPTNPPATLYPWDLRPGNALVDGGRVTAVVDWGGPLAATAALGVAKTEHLVADWYVAPDEATGLREAFRSGYGSVRPLPRGPVAYRLAAVVHSAVDSRGEVTRPGYPERTGEAALAFHRRCLERWL